ncbi:serine kinase of HPr protein (carbohydrate metabolism regulator) [Altererythrobacter atlanticus]|uniref:HPr kinase/phosphorylase n=1 Tax=Croceibacterium atlanticum TaxID=1267766 RepID=A0A0F7KSE4_9SPHN|nr:HPr kinase/phosphatase C-terminal domain-containing protein [Croceibacterium atlanticum]AKH42046.1 HPr kinase/phosphorylase [Croceibacterium atlanticum]MBB5733386.1 serine kinase of HPr protein (carbohydrate metabolism regulator) [Croceibacterium atlanticum]
MNGLLHQASCVAIGGRAVLIEGGPGSGKSSLALALIDRGAELVGDDGVTLASRMDRLHASPPPNIRGLLEVRNVGLIGMEAVSAPVALVICLDPAAPRFIETAEIVERTGMELPMIRLWPDSPVLHLRAEQALKIHGLP